MFTNEDRLELLEIWEKISNSATECLELHNVLPASITNQGEKVGIKIVFQKKYKKEDTNELLPAE